MEENPYRSNPGTFIAGIFDISAAQVEEIVNLPNPVNFVVSVDGEKFDIFTMKVLSHKRILDMKNGALIRETIFLDARERKFLYQSVRFFSMAEPHICAMKISIKSLNSDVDLAVIDTIDDSVYNAGGLMLSRRRHFNFFKADKEDCYNYVAFKTNTYKQVISYGDALLVKCGSKAERPLEDRFCTFGLKRGEEITFTKLVSIYTSEDYSRRSIKRETMRLLNDSVKKGFDGLFRAHVKAFDKRWQNADIVIEGDNDLQIAVRFNIYHLLIAAREEYAHCSIGAKTLSGQGYRGHIFWDTEIYMLPFFIYTDPSTAKNQIMFRYNTLPQAKKIAAEKGYKGAMYPWEATINGTEQTPRYSKDVDGKIVEVKTQDYEHHITADVAFGVYNYYKITGDEKFMRKYGAEIVFETARFWASRVEYNNTDKKYHINGVIGPDEFHIDVNDNAYTNYIAAWNLKYAAELHENIKNIKKKNGEKSLHKRMKITDTEVQEWLAISENIVILHSRKKGIIKQFDTYLKKDDYTIKEYDNNFLPLTPKQFEYEGLDNTSLIKQSDVLLLFCLFPEYFSDDTKRKNYEYYIQRTIHKSSLSYCMHSILANDLGDHFRAFTYFWMAVQTDLLDVPKNTAEGIHAANLGGIWQALIFGYAGLKCTKDEVSINPKLPWNLKTLSFRFFYKGDLYEVQEHNQYVNVRFVPANKKSAGEKKIKVFGKDVKLVPYRYKKVKTEEVCVKMITAKDIMKEQNFVTVNVDTPVKEIGAILVEKKASSVPVVDKNNNIKGIISEKNIIQATFDNKFAALKASDIMEKKAVCVNYNDSLEDITKIFTQHPYRRLPVLKDKEVIGVITRRDIIADFLGGYY
jgi:kojibiose phosphorylase